MFVSLKLKMYKYYKITIKNNAYHRIEKENYKGGCQITF